MSTEQVLSIFLQVFLMLALPAIAVPLAKFVVAKANAAWLEFKQKQPQVADVVETAAHFAVIAAEQAKLGDILVDKKAYALEAASAWLRTKKLDVDLTLIDAAIEKAVFESFNKDKAQ